MKITLLPINFTAKPMPKNEAHYLKEKLENSSSVDLICHELTDRDSLNSALIMQEYLDNKGIQSKIILSLDISKLGSKSSYKYVQAKDFKPEDKADTLLCLDFSDRNRIAPNILEYIDSSDNVLCIDHHEGSNIIPEGKNLYVDTSAKSATSILYRFFESNNEDITSHQAYRIILGLVDDGLKKELFKLDKDAGKIKATPKLLEDKNACEVFSKAYSKLDKEQIDIITKKLDILSALSEPEKEFSDSLYSKLQFSNNGKIAYVEIPPDDEEWKQLGGDNARTSTILNRFRQDVLNNKFNDERLNNVELAIAFYEAEGNYRISAHSKNSTLLDFYQYVEDTKIPDFTKKSGGHPNRGGGRIHTDDKETCHQWVEDIISCDKFYDL